MWFVSVFMRWELGLRRGKAAPEGDGIFKSEASGVSVGQLWA